MSIPRLLYRIARDWMFGRLVTLVARSCRPFPSLRAHVGGPLCIWFLRTMVALVIVAGVHTSAFAAPPAAECRARPAWCVSGYVCEPTPCTVRATVALERLGAQLVAARAERPRWFRPFLEAGATWSVLDQAPGVYGEAGVILWRRVNLSAEVTQEDVRAKVGWRREW